MRQQDRLPLLQVKARRRREFPVVESTLVLWHSSGRVAGCEKGETDAGLRAVAGAGAAAVG